MMKLNVLLCILMKFPKNWFDWLSDSLIKCGFHLIEYDFCLYVIDIVICVIYVDNCFFNSNQGDNIDETIQRAVNDNLNMKIDYCPQHSRNLFYHLQLIIYHLQVIWHKHSSSLNLIINTLLQIKTRTTPQIQMTTTHV